MCPAGTSGAMRAGKCHEAGKCDGCRQKSWTGRTFVCLGGTKSAAAWPLASEECRGRMRHSDGVIPKIMRDSRLKQEGSPNPAAKASTTVLLLWLPGVANGWRAERCSSNCKLLDTHLPCGKGSAFLNLAHHRLDVIALQCRLIGGKPTRREREVRVVGHPARKSAPRTLCVAMLFEVMRSIPI